MPQSPVEFEIPSYLFLPPLYIHGYAKHGIFKLYPLRLIATDNRWPGAIVCLLRRATLVFFDLYCRSKVLYAISLTILL